MTAEQTSEQRAFEAARQIADRVERQAYVEQVCAGDKALLERVQALLRVHDDNHSFLELPAARLPGPATAELPLIERPGDVIGPYTLLEAIGEGGMGVVYKARQIEPVERFVALKIIKPGLDSRQVIARFDAERQALARMDHPNIAKVLDAGTTEHGRPYFVMELVQGLPITRFCDENQLCVKGRLELMIPVCQAIQHAHQKGIIHRDIKPSNVLVATYDGRPVSKVIDFGIAKAIGVESSSRRSQAWTLTRLGQIIGTLEYMAPEQAEVTPEDIDTRADIYSLGVLLYELLTGVTPFDKQQFRDVAFHEMLRIIREEEPARPSTRLSSLDALPSVAATRGTEPARLTQAVRGELDWIVMKALDKDKSRRYDSASNLALDLQRFLQDEPVLACPPSTAYRLQKYTRKHRVLLTTASLVVLALLAGTIVSTWQAIRAKHAETLAKQSETRALQGEARLKMAATELEQQLQKTEKQSRLLESQRLLLENTSRAHSLVTERILDVMKDAPMPPAKRKALLETVVSHLDELEPAVRVEAFRAAGQQFFMLQDLPSAVAAFSEGLVLSPHHSGLHLSRAGLYFRQQQYEKALQDFTDAIAYRPADEPPERYLLYARRAFAHCQLNQWDLALADLNVSYAESPKPTLDFLTKGFSGSHELMKAPFAEPLHAGVVQLFDRYVAEQRGSEDARTIAGNSLAALKSYAAAQRHFEAAIAAGTNKDFPYYSLALVLLERGDQEGYRRVCGAMLAKSSSVPHDEFAAFTAYTAALGKNAFDDYSAVIDLARRGLAKQPTSSRYRFSLGALLLRAGRYEEARQRLHETLASNPDSEVPQTYVRYFVSMADYHAGRAADAKRALHRALQTPQRSINWRFDTILIRIRRESIDLIDPSASAPPRTASAPTAP